MARPIAFNRDEVLFKAIEVFWERGYKHTTLDNLTQAMGINRFSVYNSFGDKHALYLQALQAYRQGIADVPLSALEQSTGISGIIKHFEFLQLTAHTAEGRRGCLIMNASLEVAPKDAIVAAEVELQFDRMEQGFVHCLQQAQCAGEIKGIVAHQARATALLSLVHGVITMARGGHNLQRIDATVAALKADVVHW